VLDPDVLVDDMVAVIDDLRGELHPEFGVRAYRLHSVLRTWTGPGMTGKKTDVVTEITPQPRVEQWDGRKFELVTCGLNEAGEIRLTEVSLSYTYPQLCGPDLDKARQQWMLKITDAHGQLTPASYWAHSKAPFVDREETLGWVLWLRKVEVAT